MSRLPKRDLLERLMRAIYDSDWDFFVLSDHHPFRLQIYRADESYRVRIYIWNLTHGGGKARPREEYRIQITGLSIPRFELEPGGKTLILGWWEEAGVFVGFDFQKHSGLLGASPSIQIRQEALEQARLNGFALYNKGNQEIAIAFKPDFLLEYIRNLEALHSFGDSEHDISVLDEVAASPDLVNEEIIESLSSQPRRNVVVSVRKRLRDASFQARVLMSYNHRCAVCGLQMRLIEAAHIIPVSHEQSTDETSNGIALCVLHHRAYDRALIYIAPTYHIHLNPRKIQELEAVGVVGGLTMFTGMLRTMIIVPPSPLDRPKADYLRQANIIRNITY